MQIDPKYRETPEEYLRRPVGYLKGVGEARASVLAKMGIRRAYDLLFYFPRDYLEIVLRRSASSLTDDAVQSIAGTIQDFQTRYTRRGPLVILHVEVGDDVVEALWFNVPYITNSFHVGRPLILTGKPRINRSLWSFSHPRITYLDSGLDIPWRRDERGDEVEEKYVLPIYSLTEGMSQAQLQRIIRNALAVFPDLLSEALPDSLRQARGLAPIAEAIRLIHYPSTPEEAEYARRRFAYQELLVMQLALAICRTRRRVNMKAPPLPGSVKIDSRIRRLFPFEFTDAQNKAIQEISADLGLPAPMNRLLQGDVGSGKTVVALYAALQAAANGAQSVLMAPTETLARQHIRTLEMFLRGTATKIVPFFGAQKTSERAEVLASIESGDAQIVVGTQALVYNELKFKKLGLVIIDEQHKFGVKQRASLKSSDMTLEPHYLVMTATPIPRSLTMTFFGDLDVSVMRGAPPGRLQPTTSIVTEKTFDKWLKFVRARLDEGRQAYFVVPRVESDGTENDSNSEEQELPFFDGDSGESEFVAQRGFWNRLSASKKAALALDSEAMNVAQESADAIKPPLKTVASLYDELSEGALRNYRIGVLHGRMPTEEKEAVMKDFREKKLQCLVATSVVEVGVDVPNATLMTIFNAERFGLAQLHQLRGRITRGKFPGFCAVIPTPGATTNKGSAATTSVKKESRGSKEKSKRKKGRRSTDSKGVDSSQERLQFFCESYDGFALAEKDFEMRGPGELFGSKQHGAAMLRVADLYRDRAILEEARDDASRLTREDPGLSAPELGILRRQVLARYGRALDLGDVG
ncbi:MAG: ATP-dependent DNA helicase RecG [Thermoguttaceae bacterium]|jgi:ATP-dependent DNA helicase RecG